MNTAFIFPGQGSQFVGMGKELFDNFSVAKNIFEEVDDALSLKLSKIILEGSEEKLTSTQNTQPALMCVSMAVTRVIEELSGKKLYEMASLAAGHSLGQYSAICAMGGMSVYDAAKILKLRGEFMQESAKGKNGAMAAVIAAPFKTLEQILESASNIGICQIANDNSKDQIVISGEDAAIDFAIALCKDNSIKAIKLKVSAAFHSKLMESAADEMREILTDAKISKLKKPIIDNVSLEITDDPEFIKEKLIEQIPGTVRWRETMDLISKKCDSSYEIGAGKVLTNLFKKSYPEFISTNILSINEIDQLITEI
jgi:[acyl-carrier-protein] S-malonyltransferase